MSLGGNTSESSSRSQSTSDSFGFNQSQSYVDPVGQAQQGALVNRFSNNFAGLSNTPGLDFNRQDVMQGMRVLHDAQMPWAANMRQQSNIGANALQPFSPPVKCFGNR
jgi:hypothetical protein